MAETEHSPVWARSRRRSRGNPIIGFLVALLAIFGAVVAVASVKEGSIAEGGVLVDHWITTGVAKVKEMTSQAAAEGAESAGDAAADAGEAIQSGANNTADSLKKAG